MYKLKEITLLLLVSYFRYFITVNCYLQKEYKIPNKPALKSTTKGKTKLPFLLPKLMLPFFSLCIPLSFFLNGYPENIELHTSLSR